MRDPRLDPRKGDELLGPDGMLYQVAGLSFGKVTTVRLERLMGRTVYQPLTVTLDQWREMAAGFEVEFVSGERK